ERIFIGILCAVGRKGRNRAGDARQIPGRGRGALELPDGSGDHLRHPAPDYLLRLPPQDERRFDHGRDQRLKAAPTSLGRNKMKLIKRRQALGGVGAAVAAGTGLMPRRARAAGELTGWGSAAVYKA